jgi:hypothetical protein
VQSLHAPRHFLGDPTQRTAQFRAVRQIAGERRLGADRLSLVLRLDGAIVDAARRNTPPEPSSRVASTSPRRARSPIVRIPAERSLASAFGPIPHSDRIGNGAKNCASVPGGTTTNPSGFSMSDATLATLLLLATPADSVSDVSRFTSALRSAAISRGDAPSLTHPLTSRYASSSESGSTSGVSARKIVITRRDISP